MAIQPPIVRQPTSIFERDTRRAIQDLIASIETIEPQDLDLFTSTAAGIVAASGGGTSNFLRADGTWAAPPVSAPLPFSGNIVTPAAIAGSTNDWNAFGGDTNAGIVRASTTGAAQNVTGLTGGSAGRVAVLFNIGATGNIAFKREDTNSAAANRFTGPTGSGDITINPGMGVFFWYDGTTSRWRVIFQP